TTEPTEPTEPTAEQAVVTGTYRSHDPWTPLFRVEARGADLWLTFPAAPDGFDDEQPLVPMARGWFRVGADRLGPERLRFDTVIDGRARRAWLSGWDYYRV
ncbi:MAG: serine hydrolase, partial [Candidatus Limnocylindrales bacterium]